MDLITACPTIEELVATATVPAALGETIRASTDNIVKPYE